MGANGYRTAHYPHSEATFNYCDELGFLVMAETRWFESTKEGLEQLEMLIKTHRNNPSVIMWSLGNEEPYHSTTWASGYSLQCASSCASSTPPAR